MTLDEKIISLGKILSKPLQPPLEIPNSIIEFDDATCEIYGSFQQHRRISTTYIKIPIVPSRCPSCIRDELIKLQAEETCIGEASRKRSIEMPMEALDTPSCFSLCTLRNYEPVNEDAQHVLKVCQVYANRWPERLKKDGGFVMCGKPGTGKNRLAFGTVRIAIAKYQSSVVFTTALKIIKEYKSAQLKGSTRTEDDVIHYSTKPNLLTTDEVGVQLGSGAERLIMFEIISTRHEHMKPTILISNQTKEEFSVFIGERVIDRMSDGGGCTLLFTWGSYRLKGAA